MDPFRALGKQLGGVVKESQERWKRIEAEENDIKVKIKDSIPIPNEQLAGLILMVIEQIRPLYTFKDAEADIDQIIKKMLKKK